MLGFKGLALSVLRLLFWRMCPPFSQPGFRAEGFKGLGA